MSTARKSPRARFAELCLASDRDGLQGGVHPQFCHQVLQVAANRVSGQVHALSGFAPADAFDQVAEHLSLPRGEPLQWVLRTVLSFVPFVYKQPEDGTHRRGREPYFAAYRTPDAAQQMLDRFLLWHPSGDLGAERLHHMRGLWYRSQHDHPGRLWPGRARTGQLGGEVKTVWQLAVQQHDDGVAAFEQSARSRH